jgi:hypothetical protein
VVVAAIIALANLESVGMPALPALQKVSADAARPEAVKQLAVQAMNVIEGKASKESIKKKKAPAK